MTGGVGTSVCYHRCLSHRSLRLNRVVEDILIFFTIFNASGEPMNWVANHRHHHAKADTADDVSSPRHGGVDSSRNISWLGPLQLGAWGENWHKNHHSDANSARFGRRWWQIDIGWYVISGLKALGLASDIKGPRETYRKNASRAA